MKEQINSNDYGYHRPFWHPTQSYLARFHFPTSPALNAQLLARESCSLNPRLDLLHRYIPRKIRASMLRLDINTKRAKAAIVRRAQLIFRNVFTRLDQVRRHVIRSLDLGVQRVRDSDKRDLLDSISVAPDVLADLLVQQCLLHERDGR